MARKRTASLTLSKDDLAALRTIAQSHGFLIGKGAYINVGSINQLLAAVAAGDLIITTPPAPPKPPARGAMKVVFTD